jgi:hypothetical protein
MKKIVLLICLIVIFNSLNAQAPVNDEPCGAINIPVLAADPISAGCYPAIYQYTNATTSIGIPNPSCQFGAPSIPNNIRDVWYKCIVPASGRLKIIPTFTDLSGYYNHMNVTVYSGSNCNGTGFTEVGCAFSDIDYFTSNVIPMDAIVLTGLTAGNTLYIRLMNAFTNFGPTNFGSVNICITDYNLSFPVIDNTNKVGIGTSIPYAKLDVAGTGIFRDNVIFAKSIDLRNGFKMTSGAGVGNVLTSDANGNASWLSPVMQTNYWSLNGSNLINNNAGNVGIGTTSPTSKLNINGQVTIDQKNFGNYGGLLIKGNIPGSNYPNIAFSIKNNSNADAIAAMIQGDLQNNGNGTETIDITFLNSQTGLSGLTEKMRIKANGNIGIGTNNPSAPLSFANTIGDKISLFSNSATQQYGMGIVSNTLQLFAPNTSDIAFGTGNSAGFTENLRIKGNGSLRVGGSVGTSGQMLVSRGANASASWADFPIKSDGKTNLISVIPISTAGTLLPDLSLSIANTENATLIINVTVVFSQTQPCDCCNQSCNPAIPTLRIMVDGVEYSFKSYLLYTNSCALCSGTKYEDFGYMKIENIAVPVSAGSHTITFWANKNSDSPSTNLVYVNQKTSSVISYPR